MREGKMSDKGESGELRVNGEEGMDTEEDMRD